MIDVATRTPKVDRDHGETYSRHVGAHLPDDLVTPSPALDLALGLSDLGWED